MITVVIVSFHSQHLVFDRIEEIGTGVPIIIVENSKDIELKKKLESKYSHLTSWFLELSSYRFSAGSIP